MARALDAEGYLASSCTNLEDALEELNERPADLIVLDVKEVDGAVAAFGAKLRADPALARVPVVTVLEQTGGMARIAGDVGLVRPFTTGELLVAVERALLRAERRALADRFEQTERLAMLGTVAASIGHDLNNPLAFAIGNLDLAEEALEALRATAGELRARAELPEQRRLDRGFDALSGCFRDERRGLEQVRAMAADLVALARRRAYEQRRIDLRRILESSVTMAKGQFADHAIVTCEYGEGCTVVGDEARLGQLFVNLLVNAAQSIPAGNPAGNSIHVAAYRDGESVVTDIEDTGGGMSKTQLSRIFEPFFTTKAGSGTGLGLSICRDIVDEHGGVLEVESELGRGSRFRVRLPSV